jgi:hypothetical protein
VVVLRVIERDNNSVVKDIPVSREFGLDRYRRSVLGGRWMGSRWMGSRWMGSRWMGGRWMGDRWMGDRWMGDRWMGDRWRGRRKQCGRESGPMMDRTVMGDFPFPS